MRGRELFAALMLLAAAAAGCGPGVVRIDDAGAGDYRPADSGAVRGMLDGLAALAKKSPVSYTADFTVDGASGARKYRIMGSAQFDRGGRLLHVAFKDFIFKSTVSMFFQEGDAIRVYYPVEKKMFVDNARTFDLANYGGTSLEYGMIYDLATGAFPLIKGYRVRSGMAAKSGNGSMLVLENSDYFQTVSFIDGVPDRIMLTSRKSGEKTEFRLKKIMTQGESVFFSSVAVLAGGAGLRLEINFNRVSLNAPVKVKTVRDVSIPASVKVYTM